MSRGKLLVISGLSAGAGKDTLINMFLKKHPEWAWPPSTTTREPRPGEKHGEHMNFLSFKQFDQWRSEGKFLESDFHAENWYGTLKQPVEDLLENGKNVIIRIDVNGALQIKKQIPQALLIFIEVESEEELEKRLRSRGTETEEQIRVRLELAQSEHQYKEHFDNVVVNAANRAEEALAAIEKIVGL